MNRAKSFFLLRGSHYKVQDQQLHVCLIILEESFSRQRSKHWENGRTRASRSFRILEILKRNPSVLSSVLQTAQATTNGQTGVLKSPRSCSSASRSDQFEDPGQNGAMPAVESEQSAEDFLARRGPNGKGSNAQQTFWVGQIIVTNNLSLSPILLLYAKDKLRVGQKVVHQKGHIVFTKWHDKRDVSVTATNVGPSLMMSL